MGGDALRDMYANRGKLPLANLWQSTTGALAGPECPDTSALRDALRHHAELCTGADQNLFQKPDKIDRSKIRAALARKVASQIDDRIANQLTWPVIGHVAASVHNMG